MATVAIVMGSKSDMVSLKGAFETLNAFQIDFEVRVISAHRTPDAAADFAKNADILFKGDTPSPIGIRINGLRDWKEN